MSQLVFVDQVLGEKALSWVTAENTATVAKLGDPKESPLYDRILSILENKEKIPMVRKIGDHYYNFWQVHTRRANLGSPPRASYPLSHVLCIGFTYSMLFHSYHPLFFKKKKLYPLPPFRTQRTRGACGAERPSTRTASATPRPNGKRWSTWMPLER